MKPPYQITPSIISLVASISERLGEVRSAYLSKPPTELRKRNRIKTIHSSLVIEGNTLSVEQVTAIMEGKRVLAPQKDILEVQNAVEAYANLSLFNPYSLDSLCKAHGLMMESLIESAGRLRSSSVGIMKGEVMAHVAPPAEMVKPLLKQLFEYLKNDSELLLIKSCVFHYEFEFIHPFIDGNGRMGRLWQTVVLKEYNPVFEFLPIETLIKGRQAAYYEVLAKADSLGDSTPFVEFMLTIIDDSLNELLGSQNVSLTAGQRVDLFRDVASSGLFTRADYLRHFKAISTATASRDLRQAAERGILVKSGEGRLTSYRYK